MQPTPRHADTHWSALMRIAVVGTPGAGKTTAAKTMAAALGLPHIELDSIHWEPGWRALTKADPDEFTRRVSAAVAPDAWVVDGNSDLLISDGCDWSGVIAKLFANSMRPTRKAG
jgi:adenylate kinase family enzyme